MPRLERLGAGVMFALALAQCAPLPKAGEAHEPFWIGIDGKQAAQLVPLGPGDARLVQAGAVLPAAFVHPLVAPSGIELTELYPADHIHHRGLFWAWHQIVIDGVQRADDWLLTGLSFHPVSSQRSRDGASGTMVTEWIVADRAVLRETARITAVGDGVDLTLMLMPLIDGLALGGSADDKGYGGVSLRLRDAERMRFESDGRRVEARRQAVPAGETMRFSWDMPAAGMPRAVTMRCTVDGRAITQWILRREKSMQNCVWPGATPVALPKGRVVRLTAEIRYE